MLKPMSCRRSQEFNLSCLNHYPSKLVVRGEHSSLKYNILLMHPQEAGQFLLISAKLTHASATQLWIG